MRRTEVPEEGDAQLRGYYCLESDWTQDEEAQVSRGDDAEITIVDPELSERSQITGPGAVATLGEEYGTVDADEDDDLDGLALHTYQEDDPAGTWRGISMANDNAGVRSPGWRTHEPVRMITANQGLYRHYFASFAIEQHLVDEADAAARARFPGWGLSHHWTTDGVGRPATDGRGGFDAATTIFFYGHQKLYNTNTGQGTAGTGDLAGIGVPMGGGSILIAEQSNAGLVSGDYDPVVALDELPWVRYGNLSDAVVVGCRSYTASGASFCAVLKNPAQGNVPAVIGVVRAIHHELSSQWCGYLWAKFADSTAGWSDILSYAQSEFWTYWILQRTQANGMSAIQKSWFQQSEQIDYENVDFPSQPADYIFRYNGNDY